jgi:hypothetical protein
MRIARATATGEAGRRGEVWMEVEVEVEVEVGSDEDASELNDPGKT